MTPQLVAMARLYSNALVAGRVVLSLAAIATYACTIDAQRGLVGTYYAGEEEGVDPDDNPDSLGGAGGTGAGNGYGATGGSMQIDPDDSMPPDQPMEYGLVATVRDFKVYNAKDTTTNPDFENVGTMTKTTCAADNCRGGYDDREIVADLLGDDYKPVYKNPTGRTGTTHGKAFFDEWFRDTPKSNIAISYTFKMMRNENGAYEYDSAISGIPLSATNPTKMFFPIDKQGFGNQNAAHNYSFTVELHTKFTYRGGEFFEFRGDDDLFVYINKRLVINLGGIHAAEADEVRIDTLGLTIGQDYALDLFAAERHERGSNMRFTTTLYLESTPPR